MISKVFKIIFFSAVFLMVSSCISTLDRENPNSLLEYGSKYFLLKNYDSLLTLTKFKYETDEIGRLVESTRYKQIEDILKNSDEINLLSQSIYEEILDVEQTKIRRKQAEYYYNIDGEYYKLLCDLERSKNNEYYIDGMILRNLSKECYSIESIPVTNISIKYIASFWSTIGPRAFKRYTLRLKNISTQDYSGFKYKLILRDSKGMEIFNRTLHYDNEILVGDIIDIDVPSLFSYPVNFTINKNTFSSEFEIVSVTNKSISDSCKKIDELAH